MDTVSPGGSLTKAASIGVQAKDYKAGDVLKLVIHGYGGISTYFDDMVLGPMDRLVEVDVKSVLKVKKQEYIEA